MLDMEVIADYGDLCGECPIWDNRDQVLYWTDITGQRFYRYLWQERRHELVRQGFELAGFALRESGGFVVTNSTGFWLWDEKGSPRLLADEAEGRRCVLNDCIADPEGRVYSGSCFYDPNRSDYELGCLFRADTDGSVHVVDEGIQLSNGLGFSPDYQTLYLSDSAARLIFAYDYNRQEGTLRNRRVFVKVPSEEGVPDGLTVDAEGFVWCAHWFGGCVIRYDPDGRIERRIVTPASQTSCLTFGGPDCTDIFITSAGLSDSLPLAPPGYDPGAVYTGGKLFHLNLGIRGRPENRARTLALSGATAE
jgi:D-xylonolactonase